MERFVDRPKLAVTNSFIIMKIFLSIVILLVFVIKTQAQWNTDLTANLVMSETGRIENVLYDGSGYFLTWQEGIGPFTHVVNRLNLDGTSAWNAPILAHNHDLGSFTVSLQYTALDAENHFVRVSSYINDNGEFCCINKIDASGTQLLNGEAGVEFSGLAMGFTLAPSGNMYLLVGSDLKKLDGDGNIIWTSTLDPDHLNNREAKIIESADGTVGVAYFVPGMGNPTYGYYYISRFDAAGNRTTVGDQQIAPASCSFYRPWYFTEMSTGHYYFIGFDTNSSVSFVQHLMGDEPMIGGNGTPLDNSANSSFITATVAGDSLYAFYQYNWNSFDEGGLKMQSIDLATGAHGYDQGLNLYGETDGIVPRQNSAVDLGGHPGCMIVEWPSNVSRLLEIGANGPNTYPLFTSSTVKSQVAVSSLHSIGNNEQQLVAFMEDYRVGGDYPYAVAQNLVLAVPTNIQAVTSSNLILYPNPSRDFTHLSVEDSHLGFTCTLINQLGCPVTAFTLTQRSTCIETASLPAGVYTLLVQGKAESLSRKLVVE
jgi:hypothetical protein